MLLLECMEKKKVVAIIGGGAAGFFCAVNAAKRNSQLRVIILEKSNKLLAKVRVSGGGRCNVTNACQSIEEMIKNYPRGQQFLRKTFHHFFTSDTVDWFTSRGAHLKTEPDGRVFPVTNSSATIIECLISEAVKFNVEILTNRRVLNILPVGSQFELQIEGHPSLLCHYVCVACGGFPKAEMFDWLTRLGHQIEDPAPSLFTFNLDQHAITDLQGVVVNDVQIKIAGSQLRERGPVLITHWGFSGPCILRLSAWGATELKRRGYEFEININWLPAESNHEILAKIQLTREESGFRSVESKNPFGLPQRLWSFLVAFSDLSIKTKWAELKAKEQRRLIANIGGSLFKVKGKTTFKEEFVTAGGLRLSQVDHNTMQSKLIKGLYFAGEILDVDGLTGGFNFQHAWTSGFLAAKAIANNV